MLFSLGLDRAMRSIHARLEAGELAFAYLDDVYLVVRAARAREMFEFAAAQIEAMTGIRTHLGKLKIWGPRVAPAPPGVAELGPEVWVSDAPPASRGRVMLGSPLGHVAFVHAWCAQRALVTRRLTERFPLLSCAQCRWLLLRYSADPRTYRVPSALA